MTERDDTGRKGDPRASDGEEKRPELVRRGSRRSAGADTPAGPKTRRTPARAKQEQAKIEEAGGPRRDTSTTGG